MEVSKQSDNPLGLNLDFMFGRGYLWAERQRISDWIALESLRMEIPDLQFPFDARGGLNRFRHTRCLVRDVEFAISEVGLGDLLGEAASKLEGFRQLEIRFLDDAAHISFELGSLGTDTYVSFRAALIPPEPARADEVHLSLYDYRAFGPLPYPARLVVHELMTGLLNTPAFRAPGRGASFTVGIAGDIIRFRPLKLLFLHIFPKVGWKLPNLSGVVLDTAKIRPGVLTIRAVDDDPKSGPKNRGTEHELAATEEGARALAAYESKELFSHADQALFDGQIRQALSLLSNYRDVYGLDPGLVARLLDCLVADASPANLAEAESIRRELVDEDPESMQAALVAPIIELARRRPDEARKAFEKLADTLRDRQQTRDWILCELALADLLSDDEPEAAAARLREVLKRDPRHRAVLERLRSLYEHIDSRSGLEETLKRLTGVYTERRQLQEIYLELARHLMEREGDLAEARMYLEKVLRLDATQLDALHALGESYVLGGEPLRALKAFGSAARTAEAEERNDLAAELYFRVGQLWFEEMEDPRQALLAFRRSLAAGDGDIQEATGARTRARRLGLTGEMCEQLGRHEEATDYWRDAVQLLERVVSGDRPDFEAARDDGDQQEVQRELQYQLRDAHRHLGRLYQHRDRPSAAASHFRRILELDATDREALEWLEEHLRRGGRPEELIELYRNQIDASDSEKRRLEFIEKLADLYAALGFPEDGQTQYRTILDADPTCDGVRTKLVELLSEHRRFETLRDALNTVLVRTRDHHRRHDILMELGGASESIGDLKRATRSYLEAAKLQPGDRTALENGCRVLEAYVEEHGVDASAPVGSSTAGRLLEKMLIRFAEVVPSASQERELLLKVAMRAEERGDGAVAGEARDRAAALAGPDDAQAQFDDVDDRLDAMLDELSGDGDDSTSTPSDEQFPEDPSDPPARTPRETPTRQKMPSVDIPSPSSEKPSPASSTDGGGGGDGLDLPRPSGLSPAGEFDEPDDSGDADGDSVQSFRRRFASMKKRPSELPNPDEIDDKSVLDSRHGGDEPDTVQMPVGDFESLREDSSPPESDDQAPDDQGPDGWSLSLSDEPTSGLDEESEIDTAPRIKPVEMARQALEEARNSGDKREIAESIEQVLTLAEGSGAEMIDDTERASMSREAGELFYYDLDDVDAARPHLERVRRLEPDGRGANPEVLNALESIYEERGDVESRIQLLEARLEAADTEQMKMTYRLLLAQTLWDKRSDADGARRWLDEVLTRERDHEAAHRLLAQIARDEEDWAAVTEHLETVVEVSGGGIDTVEARRELAEVLLRRLDAPGRAIEHFEQVLEAAPGDSQALDGIKEAQGVVGNWSGYVDSLGRELGLLVGRPQGFDVDEITGLDPDDVSSAVRVPASEIAADVAHVVDEQLDEPRRARRLWGVAYQLWPEHAGALERRIELNRQCDAFADLAVDLESYAALLLDANRRFEALVEAARIQAHELEQPDDARPLYTEALAIVDDADNPPDELGRVRRELERLQEM